MLIFPNENGTLESKENFKTPTDKKMLARWRKIGSQGILKVMTIHPQGDMNFCT